jgi:small nuclear ribonucleoprotein
LSISNRNFLLLFNKKNKSIKLYIVIYDDIILSIDVTVQVLKENIGKNIVIKLKGDKVVKGILEKFDQHMNLVLSDATEYKAEETTKLGNLLLKGDNIIIISPQE